MATFFPVLKSAMPFLHGDKAAILLNPAAGLAGQPCEFLNLRVGEPDTAAGLPMVQAEPSPIRPLGRPAVLKLIRKLAEAAPEAAGRDDAKVRAGARRGTHPGDHSTC
jgi:hypothetical protein